MSELPAYFNPDQLDRLRLHQPGPPRRWVVPRCTPRKADARVLANFQCSKPVIFTTQKAVFWLEEYYDDELPYGVKAGDIIPFE